MRLFHETGTYRSLDRLIENTGCENYEPSKSNGGGGENAWGKLSNFVIYYIRKNEMKNERNG